MTDLVSIGANRLGFDPHPDQTELGALLDGGAETNAVCWPRRAGKTTGTWAWILGDCEANPDTQWITTAQNGVKARDRFMSMARLIDKRWPEDEGGPHIYRGAGHEALEFTNGSRLWVVAPKPDNFRGDGANVYIDEPQEFDLQQSDDLEQAVYPLFDTIPGRVVLSGTPGKSRSGWFWKALQGGDGHSVSWFAIPEHLDVNDEANWTQYHPGLRWGLTTIEKMRARHAGMSEAAWRMEYAGQWPYDSGTGAFDTDAWADAGLEFTERGERVGIAYDVAVDSTSATLATAWRDEAGKAYVEIVEHRGGTNWLSTRAYDAFLKWRQPVTHDRIGANADVDNALQRKRGVKIDRLGTSDIIGAAARFAEEFGSGNVAHFNQPDLTAAIENATWRQIANSGRAFTSRVKHGAPINPLVACSLALWAYDKGKDRSRLTLS